MSGSPQWRFLAVLLLPAGMALTVWSLMMWPPASSPLQSGGMFWIALAPLLSIHLVLPLLDAFVGDDPSPAQSGSKARPGGPWQHRPARQAASSQSMSDMN